jgi:hypothetical protein
VREEKVARLVAIEKRTAIDAVVAYVKAARANDVNGALMLVGPHWLEADTSAKNHRVISDRVELAKLLPARLAQIRGFKQGQSQRANGGSPYQLLRIGIADAELRKNCDDVIGMNGWMVWCEDWLFLVRIDGGQAAVVGGPFPRFNDLLPNKVGLEMRAILENAENFELFSLEPNAGENSDPTNGFQGWTVLGKTAISQATVRKKLVDALAAGLEGQEGVPAWCFEPRHAIRVVHGGRVLDFLICFQCWDARVLIQWNGKRFYHQMTIGRTPQPVFDEVLRAANVPLAQ